jgi:FAD/FMN-containing dehydrogenase
LPDPVLTRPPAVDVAALQRTLAERVDGEVRFDADTRSAYPTDASNFRQVSLGVVLPRRVDAAAAAVAVCRDYGAPVLSRGAGRAWPAKAPTPRW